MSNLITQEEIAYQFIHKYNEYHANGITGAIFTDDQFRAMATSCKSNPQEMVYFFLNVNGLIIDELLETPDVDLAYIMRASNVYSNIVISLVLSVVGILAGTGKPNPMYELNDYTTDHDELFGNLDFKLPDWNSLME